MEINKKNRKYAKGSRFIPTIAKTIRDTKKSGLAKFVKIDKKLKDSKNVEEAKTK